MRTIGYVQCSRSQEKRVSQGTGTGKDCPLASGGSHVHCPFPNRNPTPMPFHSHHLPSFQLQVRWLGQELHQYALKGRREARGINLMEPVRHGRLSPERHLFQAPWVSTPSSELDRDGGAVSGALRLASHRELPGVSVLPSLCLSTEPARTSVFLEVGSSISLP